MNGGTTYHTASTNMTTATINFDTDTKDLPGLDVYDDIIVPLGLDDEDDSDAVVRVEFPDRDGTGKKYVEIPKRAAMKSLLLRDAMDIVPAFADGTSTFPVDTLLDGDGKPFDILVTDVKNIATYLVEYADKTPTILRKPIHGDDINTEANIWEKEFLARIGDDMTDITRYAIISDYLKIKPLCDLICANIGLMIRKCTTAEEIRALMQIDVEDTPEQRMLDAAHAAKWAWVNALNDPPSHDR